MSVFYFDGRFNVTQSPISNSLRYTKYTVYQAIDVLVELMPMDRGDFKACLIFKFVFDKKLFSNKVFVVGPLCVVPFI